MEFKHSKKVSSKNQYSVAIEFLLTVTIALLFTFIVRSFFFDPFHVPSGSMIPTLLPGDKMFVEKFSYGYNRHSFPKKIIPLSGRLFPRMPERGDIVVFALPSDSSTFYVKRVVGLPGDSIQIRRNKLYVNGNKNSKILIKSAQEIQYENIFRNQRKLKQYNTNYLEEDIYEEYSHDNKKYQIVSSLKNPEVTKVFHVPKEHIFVMGDNRDNSLDSRFDEVGFIPLDHVVGKAVILFFSSDGSVVKSIIKPSLIRGGRIWKSLIPQKATAEELAVLKDREEESHSIKSNIEEKTKAKDKKTKDIGQENRMIDSQKSKKQ